MYASPRVHCSPPQTGPVARVSRRPPARRASRRARPTRRNRACGGPRHPLTRLARAPEQAALAAPSERLRACRAARTPGPTSADLVSLGSGTPRAGGRLSAAAGGGEHTMRRSPAVTPLIAHYPTSKIPSILPAVAEAVARQEPSGRTKQSRAARTGWTLGTGHKGSGATPRRARSRVGDDHFW